MHRPEALRGGNRIQLLVGGAEAFPSMLEAIAQARERVHLESYILAADATGKRFQAALIERAQAGAEVRVLYDSVGSLGMIDDEFVEGLRAGGVDVREFHPIAPWRARWGLNQRDHQKLLIVDGKVGFTGGLNVGDDYAPPPQGKGWHDLHARVEGPVVNDLAMIFRRGWIRAGGRAFGERAVRAADELRPGRISTQPVLIATADNWGLKHRIDMHAAYRFALHAAQRSIDLANAYFIPDIRLRVELRRAIKRGVSVRVIVPAESDVGLVSLASRHLYARLLKAGVRIFEYQSRMMHAKAGVIDQEWATIGSYNLDRRSFVHNLEAGLVVADRNFAAALSQQFERDLTQCREVRLGEWRRRPAIQRAKEWLAFRFRWWL